MLKNAPSCAVLNVALAAPCPLSVPAVCPAEPGFPGSTFACHGSGRQTSDIAAQAHSVALPVSTFVLEDASWQSHPPVHLNHFDPGAPHRASASSKISEPLSGFWPARHPDRSFQWLIGSPTPGAQRPRRAARGEPKAASKACSDEAVPDRGLLRLDVALASRPALRRGQGEPVDECKDKRHDDHAAPLFVTAEFINNNRRDQVADRVHGRLPLMTDKGHLHHQRHRAGRGVPAGPQPWRLLRARPSTRPPRRTLHTVR